MAPRNSMRATARVLALFNALRRGEELTISKIERSCGVAYAQARSYLKLLEDTQTEVRTRREGKTKVWRWEGRRE